MNNKGMSMVEILVGFVVLSVIIAGVIHMIKFGAGMMYDSVDIKHSQEEFEAEVYKRSPDAGKIQIDNIKDLEAGEFILKPSSEPVGNQVQVSKELAINLFEAAADDAEEEDRDELRNRLQAISYTDNINDYRIKVYGFEK